MIFTSLTFAVFAVLVVLAYWQLPGRRSQNTLLLASSYVFYGWWDWRFCFLIGASSLLDFALAIAIDRTERATRRRCLLAVSIAANVGLLAVFKYFHFFMDSFEVLAHGWGWQVGHTTLNIVLPVGISFYTFQTLGYTIDVFRRDIPAARHIVDYMAFVSYFPQLVAGPIERAAAMLPQFATPRCFDADLAASGCRLMLWGTFKKLIIADRLAIIVNECYDTPEQFRGPMLVLATLFFAFQIYCDFSAYSDIAVGVSRVLGIRLMRNFEFPYFSQSVSEFWRRWHISLSTWFRDYIYVPLGGNRCGPVRKRINLLVTFLISGLWHGAAWHYVIWGGINGLALLFPRIRRRNSAPGTSNGTSNSRNTAASTIAGDHHDIPRPLTLYRIWSTTAVVSLAWIFFRAQSFAQATGIVRTILRDSLSIPAYMTMVMQIDDDPFLAAAMIWLIAFIMAEWFTRRRECPIEFPRLPRLARWAIYSMLFWTTLYAIPPTGSREFIYFAF